MMTCLYLRFTAGQQQHSTLNCASLAVQVLEGMDLILDLEKVPKDKGSRPIAPITIADSGVL